MSISKSYNKQTGVHYAYETTYEWNDELQKKVQRRRCIGKFDPETGKVIPNGKVGRPSVESQPKPAKTAPLSNTKSDDNKALLKRLKKVESRLSSLSNEIAALGNELAAISDDISR